MSDARLARRLANLAFFMIDRTLPYKSLENPFVIKGNPRFCTQYNNSETCENIGPMLSGTATWLTLAVYEFLGIDVDGNEINFSPVMSEGNAEMRYTLSLSDARLDVEVTAGDGIFRSGSQTRYFMDDKPASSTIELPHDGRTHTVTIRL